MGENGNKLMNGNKNSYNTIPFYADESCQVGCGCSPALITTPIRLIPFELDITGVDSFELVPCDGGANITLPTSLLTEYIGSQGTSFTQYNGEVLPNTLAFGTYYIRVANSVTKTSCVSEKFKVCDICLPESPGILITNCEDLPDCCDDINAAIQQPDNYPRFYNLAQATQWFFFFWGSFYQNDLITAGATNITWQIELFDNVTNASLGAGTGSTLFVPNIPNTVTEGRAEMVMTMDFPCNGGIDSFELTATYIVTPTSPFWTFETEVPDCNNLTGGAMLTLSANDTIWSELILEAIQINNGGTNLVGGQSITFQPSDSGTITITRRIETACTDGEQLVKQYELSFDTNDICGSAELTEI